MYPIVQDYIRLGNARSGQKIEPVRFIVAHDTGNPGSTARQNRSYFHNSQPSASAHTFIDDKEIVEIVPLSEKAWHVLFEKPKDNELFGGDANNCAIGVELCWGGEINFREAYKRYVWYHAYLCQKFKLDPAQKIVGHKTLDPQRKIDPDNALNRNGVTFSQFIQDVEKECFRINTSPEVALDVAFVLDGKPLDSVGIRGFIRDSRAYVPIRMFAGVIGGVIDYQASDKSIWLDKKRLQTAIIEVVEGKGTGFAQIREVADLCGFQLGWDAATKTVTITKG